MAIAQRTAHLLKVLAPVYNFFTASTFAQRAGDPTICDFTAGNPHELALPGFGGGRAVFQGRVRPEEVVKFYRTEMPGRGWKENASIVSQGGALAFSKEGRSVVVTVVSAESGTTLDILVGKLGS